MSAQGVTAVAAIDITTKGTIMADKVKVRATMTPDTVLEVDRAEFIDLHRSGILHSFERSEVTDSVDAGKSPRRWVDGKPEVVDSGLVTDPTKEG